MEDASTNAQLKRRKLISSPILGIEAKALLVSVIARQYVCATFILISNFICFLFSCNMLF
jgi:hypothetical protein